MNAILRVSLLTVAASTFIPSPAGAIDVPCAANGYCHFPRFVPAGLMASDQFGYRVATDGETALVTSRGEGAVVVYERQGTVWAQAQTLLDPHPGDNGFGRALDVDGDQLVIGSPFDDTDADSAGAVHYYERVGGAWLLSDTLFDQTPVAFGRFGEALDLDGVWLGVGAPGDNAVGHAHIYLRTFPDWALTYEIDDGADGDFGASIALYGVPGELESLVVVGDPAADQAGVGAGMVHRYRVTPVIYSIVLPKLLPAEVGPGDAFGSALAFDGEHIVVGSPNDDDLATNAGAAYVYDVQGNFYTTFADKLLPCEGQAFDQFGASADVDGDRIVVGAPGALGVSSHGGHAYTFRPALFADSWDHEDVLVGDDTLVGDQLGFDVGVSGDGVWVGARGADAVADFAGATYFFTMTNKSLIGGECPCASLADAEEYGDGKPGSVGVPHLSANGLAVPGELHVLALEDVLIGSTPILFWGLAPAGVPFDGGTLLVAAPNLVNLPTVGAFGQVGIGYHVPTDPAVCGFDIYLQAMMVDPAAAGPYHTAQSNGLRLTFGY